MGHASSDHERGAATAGVDLRGGVVAGLAAFGGAGLLVGALVVANLLAEYGTPAVLSPAGAVVLEAAWLLNAAHVGVPRSPLVLVAPGAAQQVPVVVSYVVPPAALGVAGGALVAREPPAGTAGAAALRGASVVAGYLPAAVVLFAYLGTRGPVVASPPGRALVVVGVVYPLAFGSLGGRVAARRVGGATDEAGPDSEAAAHGATTDAAGRDQRDRRDRTRSTTGPAHFEETLSTTERDRGVLAAFAVVFGIPTLGATVAVLAGVLPLASTDSLVGLLFGDLVVVAVLYLGVRSLGNDVHVRVTDGGLSVTTQGEPVFGSGDVFVPYEDVTAVQYSGPDDGRITVTYEDRKEQRRSMQEADGFVTVADSDHRPLLFEVPKRGRASTTYSDGVRVGRADAPPVYVASERARTLADAIAERAPEVEAAEEL